MNPDAEGKMLVLFPTEVQAIRIGKHRGIAIGRADRSEYEIARLDALATEVKILAGDAADPLNR